MDRELVEASVVGCSLHRIAFVGLSLAIGQAHLFGQLVDLLEVPDGLDLRLEGSSGAVVLERHRIGSSLA